MFILFSVLFISRGKKCKAQTVNMRSRVAIQSRNMQEAGKMQKPWLFIECGHEGGGFQDDCWISGLDDYLKSW